MKIWARIKALREQKGYTQEQLAQKSGVSIQSIKRYESKDGANLTLNNAEKIAQVFELSIIEFLGAENLSPSRVLSPSENLSPSLSPSRQNLSPSLSSMSPNIQKPQTILVPVYDEVVASAGSGRFNEDFKAFSVEFDKAHLKRLFALANVDNLAIIRASGDSMTPTLPPNARLLLQFRHEFKEGQIVACRLDDELFVKRLHKQPRLRLVSDNKDFEPIELAGKDYELIGVIVGFIKAFEL